MYDLPTAIRVGGKEHKIRRDGDYRVVLSAMDALQNESLKSDGVCGNERANVALRVFYEDVFAIGDKLEAYKQMCIFIDCGIYSDSPKATYKLYDWKQDEQPIAAAVSKVYGSPIRQCEYLHWWDFMAYFADVGEGQFSYICGIRNKLRKGAKLDKEERAFMTSCPGVVNLKTRVSAPEADLIKSILNGYISPAID